MKCSNCSFDNPSDARFCQNCGRSLERPCPNCGTPNPLDVRFCKNCGTSLLASPLQTTEEPKDHGHGRLEQYIPKALLEKLESARASRSMEGERRIVTVLFCDVKGSTAMAEMLDPAAGVPCPLRAFPRR